MNDAAGGSPPTDRVVTVLELLASAPSEPMTLSAIARRLGMSKATCHAIVNSLVRAEYLVRSPLDKTFTLGPGLVAAGRAAEAGYPAVRVAQAELARLSDELGMEANSAVRSEDHIIVVGHTGAGGNGRDDHATRIGRRIPLTPPFGAVFVGWAERAEQEAWIARAPGDAATRRHLTKALQAVRDRGYSIERLIPAGRRLRELLAELTNEPLDDELQPAVARLFTELARVEYLADDLKGRRKFPVSVVSVPAFDRSGVAVLNLTVHPVADLTRRELDDIAQAVGESAARITAAIGGHHPRGEYGDGTGRRGPRSRTGRTAR